MTVVHMIDRKGISPFISVILIIAMVVAIAVVVINWSDVLTRETAESVEEQITMETVCNINVGLDVWRNTQGYQRICLNTTTEELEIIFENKGSVKIENIHSSVLFNATSISSQINIDIVPGGIRVGKVEVNISSPSVIQQVVFTPAVKIQEKTYWCSDSKITVSGSSIDIC